MSKELVYHCDREQSHRLSFEKEGGKTADPVKAGWLFALVGAAPQNVEIGRVGREPHRAKATLKHFCSTACLVGWLGQKLNNPEQETKPATEGSSA